MNKSLIIILLFLSLNLFAQEAKLVLPIGHSGEISAAIFNPNSKLACTISDKDETPIIWDVETGKMLFQLIGHEAPVSFVTFSPSGSMIYTQSAHDGSTTGGTDSTVRIWDANTGKEIRRFTSVSRGKSLENSFMGNQVFSPDDKYIIVPNNGFAQIWEISSGKLIQSLKSNGDSHVLSPKTKNDPDGADLALTVDWSKEGEDPIATIWNVSSAKALHVLKGHSKGIISAVFSPDGNFVMTVSYDKTARIWSVQNGKLIHNIKHGSFINNAEFSPDSKFFITSSLDGFVRVLDLQTGELLHKIKKYFDGSVIYAAVSNDGKYLATADYIIINIHDLLKGTIVKSFDIRDFQKGTINGSLNNIRFSPDNKYLITGSSDNSSIIWDIENKKLLSRLQGYTAEIFHSSLSSDGKLAASFGLKWWRSKFYNPIVWNTKTGKILYELKKHSKAINSVKFSPDGKMLISCSDDNYSTIWNLENGKMLSTLYETSVDAIFSMDNNFVITVGWQRSTLNVSTPSSGYNATVWEVNSGKKLRICNQHKENISSVDLSKDGKFILTASADGTLKISELSTGNEVKTLDVGFSYASYEKVAKFSPDAKTVIILQQNSFREVEPEVWSVETGKRIHQLKGHSGRVKSGEFSSDGNYILTASEDNTARIWDAVSGKELIVLRGHEGSVNTANFSPDAKYILTTGNDNRSIYWNAKTGKIIYTHLQFMDGDWLLYDENYRFDGTEKARNLLYFTCGLEIVNLNQFKDALYVPGLATKLLEEQSIDFQKIKDLNVCNGSEAEEKLEQKEESYQYLLANMTEQLDRVDLKINGKVVQSYSIDKLKKVGNDYSLEINKKEIANYLSDSINDISVQGITMNNKYEIKSRGATISIESDEKSEIQPSMFLVMIGVNDYVDDKLDLKYPVKDASALGNALTLSSEKLFGKDHVFVYNIQEKLKSESNKAKADKENVKKILAEVGKKAKAEDVVLIFFAGHGTMQGATDPVFTFLTAEASSDNPVGISTKDLQEWLSPQGPFGYLANKTILIFDACNSGQAVKELIALSRNADDTRRVRQLDELKDKSGVFILAASAPNQSAYELPQYEQGLLTYSMLSVLKNSPDVLDNERYLNVQKWFLESEKELRRLIESIGLNQDAQPFGTANIRIGEVDNELRDKIILADEKPIIMCSNVLNLASLDDDLELKNKINEALLNIQERGVQSSFIYSLKETPKTNKINISYQVEGVKVICDVKLMKNKVNLHSVSVEGNSNDLVSLVNKIIEEVVRHAKK